MLHGIMTFSAKHFSDTHAWNQACKLCYLDTVQMCQMSGRPRVFGTLASKLPSSTSIKHKHPKISICVCNMHINGLVNKLVNCWARCESNSSL